MTAVLQPTPINPFSITPGPPTCRLDGPFNFLEHGPELDTISLNTIIQDRSRQPSPASLFSIASAPQPRNDENVSPLARFRKSQLQLRSLSSQSPSACKVIQKSRNFTFQPLVTEWENKPESTRVGPVCRMNPIDIPQSIFTAQTLDSNTGSTSIPNTPQILHPKEHLKETSISKVKPLNHSHYTTRTPESGLLSRTRELRQQSTGKESEVSEISPDSSLGQNHPQRVSDTSSGFVHSMKTASFTNASFSIFPRSSRVGRSTDSYMLPGSQPRYSIDSDRPLSRCSFDDAALTRGLRRQQIIDELIGTEEAYIADLKALVYLYSTLLASASSIPNRLRSAIEQNVTSILHLHEAIVAKLHAARLRAAARRWADTAVPARLGRGRRINLRYSERAATSRPTTAHRHTKSDDSAGMPGPFSQHSMPAEPIDVCEILAIFRDALTGFTAYEEYCANFEAIGHELQKQMPQLWPTYESGMESLARAVMALDHQSENNKRGLTVSDLLIKPIQRLTKYPLLLEQLLHSTPVADAPGTHTELDVVLQALRDIVHMVNLARDSHYARTQIQRRWLLQDRLDMTRLGITPDQFRSLGQIELCGVLHITYQTVAGIEGNYALCALLDEHFLVAFPSGNTGRFEAIALIQLSDIRIETSTDGKGLQCPSSFFTWKISFACAGYYHEMILSGCSRIEEDHWIAGLQGEFSQPMHQSLDCEMSVSTSLVLNLKSAGVVFHSQKSLSRESSIQRAATVGGRPSISQVIIRNTHNAQDLQEYRGPAPSTSAINRSQSHMATKRVPVLEPKRSDRTRIEQNISDIWTKERLPFPGMVGSRGGQIIRASAGTLARKLSLASIHTPFSKGRTSSLSMASRKSYDIFNDTKSTFEIRRKDPVHMSSARLKPRDIPEVDDMRSVVGRMIGGGAPIPGSHTGHDAGLTTRRQKTRKPSLKDVGPDGSAAMFYEQSVRADRVASTRITDEMDADPFSIAEGDAPRRRRKRWSNPINRLREIGSEAKSMLYSSSYGI